jgi:hypothetical protein
MTDNNEKAQPVSAQLGSALRRLVKKPCLFIDTGPIDSPFVDLHFGSKIEREQPLDYADADSEVSRYEGEMSLFISCAWRLDSAEDVVCGCWDDKSDAGQMRIGLTRLDGKTVRRVLANPPGWDLAIELDDGLLLRVFCDQTNDEEGADNYALYTTESIFTVGTMSELFVEPR